MAITFGGIANQQTQSSLMIGQAQASSMGLGTQSGNLMGVSNLMGGGSGNSMVSGLMGGGKKSGGLIGGMIGSQSNLTGNGLMSANQSVLGATLGSGGGSILDMKI